MDKWQKNFGKHFLALCFCLFTVVFGFKTYVSAAKGEAADEIWLKPAWIELNSTVARKLDMKGLYSSLGLYIAEGDYVVSEAQETTTDYEYEQMADFKKYLDEKGIQLLYVNAPTKYMDDTIFERGFGIHSYSNYNADVFMKRLSEAGIANVDLREELVEDGMDVKDMFYRTDHHWTTRSGLWAAEKVSEALNEKCGYQIDLQLFNDSCFTFKEYKNCWLGEQGRKIGAGYLGLDDFTVIKPKYDMDFVLTDNAGVQQGGFDIMLDESYYVESKEDMYSRSWHYSYLPRGISTVMIKNNNQDHGKVLVLSDSYAQVFLPFFALGVSEADKLVLRNYEGSLKKFIEDNDYDTVVIMYAQFMIGAHDNPDSANYSMFALDR